MRGYPQHVRVELLVAGQISTFDTQQIFDRSGDIVAFHNLRCCLHGPLKPFLRRF